LRKIAAKLAVGYTLDEIPNDITKKTPASFEPTIDYVVAKIPKWDFEKFKEAEDVLGTQMKSVGEVMAIGRTFKEALFKAPALIGSSGNLCVWKMFRRMSCNASWRVLIRRRFSYINLCTATRLAGVGNISLVARRSVVSRAASGRDGNSKVG